MNNMVLATIKECDNIIVLDKGKIVEQGTHEELLHSKGKYFKLWEMQQGNIRINKEVTQESEDTVVLPSIDDGDVVSYT